MTRATTLRFGLLLASATLTAALGCSNNGSGDGGGSSTAGSSGSGGSGSSGSTGSTHGATSGSGSGSSGSSTGGGTTPHGSSGTSSLSGGSSGGGGSTGSSTGGSGGGSSGAFDGGFCNGRPGGMSPQFGYCSFDTDCNCPFVCNPDDPPFSFSGGLGSVCEYGCTTSADCPDNFTSCQNGYCVYDLCDVSKTIDGSAPNGTASGPCNASDAGDGTCIVRNDARVGEVIAVCVQGGSATRNCDPGALRNDAGSLCVAGDVCVAGPDGGSCQPGCNPLDGGACASGQGCGAIDPTGTFLDFGACFTQAGSCLQGFPFDNEMAACGPSAGCGCLGSLDIECFPDDNIGTALNPFGANSYCERLCSSDSDCAIPSTICLNHWCSYDFCGQNPSGQDAGSGYDLPCNASGQGDGTCLPLATATRDPAYGLCLQGGSAGAVCSLAADRTDPTGLCGAGAYCESLPDGGAGCLGACDPRHGSTATCSSGLTCTGVLSGASVAFGTCE